MNFFQALQAALALKTAFDVAASDLESSKDGKTDSGAIAVNTRIRVKGGGTLWITRIAGEKRV